VSTSAGWVKASGGRRQVIPIRRKESLMPRIIVTTEGGTRPDAPVLLDEWVNPQHLQDEHSADQLIERIGWAVNDAEDLERRHPVPAAS
jgi:hypothetical protein